MNTAPSNHRDRALAELQTVPEEYLPFVVDWLRSFQETVRLKPARESFQQGWRKAQSGETSAISGLWDGLSAE